MPRIEAIEVKGVTRVFGSTLALRGVDAVFRAGAITVVEGPNGAGKSTLISIVATVLRPTGGRVSYGALGEDRVAARGEIGWVPHDSHCYRELSGRQNVELAARLYGVDPREGWDRVRERVGLEKWAERNVASLSRGQRQRIALARALVHLPSVLLLDEPGSGLDEASLGRLERVLKEERSRGRVVVVVSHRAGLAERIADARVRIEGGRVRQEN